MAKNKSDTVAETTTLQGPEANLGVAVPAQNALVKPSEMSAELAVIENAEAMAVLSGLVGDVEGGGWQEIVAGGDGTYWPARKGETIHGIIVERYEVPTRFKSVANPKGLIGLYSVKLLHPCVAITRDGEEIIAEPGKIIIVLERCMLKRLQDAVGKEIALVCKGQGETKSKQKLWDYYGLVRDVPQVIPQAPQVGGAQKLPALSS